MAEAAALKGKLRCTDIETRPKAKLEGVRTQTQINIAQAKFNALENIQDSFSKIELLPSKIDANQQMNVFKLK